MTLRSNACAAAELCSTVVSAGLAAFGAVGGAAAASRATAGAAAPVLAWTPEPAKACGAAAGTAAFDAAAGALVAAGPSDLAPDAVRFVPIAEHATPPSTTTANPNAASRACPRR